MNDKQTDPLQDVSLRTQIIVYAGLGVIGVAAIFIMSFFLVTLTKATQAASPWETLFIFMGAMGTLGALWRMMGLHEQ